MNEPQGPGWPNSDEVMERILRQAKRVAVVGLSAKEDRASYGVARWLQSKGYEVIGVNPVLKEFPDAEVYPDLESIPGKVDLVDVFRRSDAVPPIVDSAIAIGAGAVWLQEGVVHLEAGRKAQEAGLDVVMDRCVFREGLRLLDD